ncbi:BTB/POZ domain-containing protein [Coniochaeta ligniaria NRRL 30616]|uniref:BTB/POZ domain-containing protein n=1 Tax=Coniochaeta ligniaria NRRL 30616 TaxID=1408157 RepID=A0A1J7JAB0_9PEZI|nr:BTB/POZ domain-containing protein [Coniochaeta ligniaria NRRL 30616]
MSLLFKHFYDGDVDKFRALLAPTGYNAHPASRGYNNAGGGGGASPGAYATSPKAVTKSRKTSGWGSGYGPGKHGGSSLAKNEVNARDHLGLTVLMRAASSTAENAIDFVEALLEHPALDLHLQDYENGWNCLHRALYVGNISIARLLLDKERRNLSGETIGASASKVGHLIKTKDHEGNSPFDLFNSTVGERPFAEEAEQDISEDEGEGKRVRENHFVLGNLNIDIDGEELFTFGSNKNLSLGLGDQDDRQFPERVILKRPDHLMTRWHQEYLDTLKEEDKLKEDRRSSTDISKIPALILSRPLLIRDVVLSKLHSAVLTDDDCSNLYVCGVGRGGRLGLGDENTRFNYAPVQGGLAGEKVVEIALGQNHSMAVTLSSTLWTWGSNANSQLGYALPAPAKPDEEPISTIPRQVFGPLKKEFISGIAASSIHSVAHTGNSLYCWGRNVGQLGLMDADSRSLDVQQTPRKVAASLFTSKIVQVSAIDKATICLLANYHVICFTSYGYNIVKFPVVDLFGNYMPKSVVASNYNKTRSNIQQITASGDTIAAVTGRGDVFTFGLNQQAAEDSAAATSTTNPSKIKTAVTTPQCIWSARRDGVKSVSIGEHGSVIISTKSGVVWRRVKRAKAKDAYVGTSSGPKRNDFKFQRVPYITNIMRVAASPFGAFAAIRRDCDVMRKQIHVDEQTLWDDVMALNCLRDFQASEPTAQDHTIDAWNSAALKDRISPIAYEVLKSPDIETDLRQYLDTWSYLNEPLDAAICTSSAPELLIPIHRWLLSARSSVLRQALVQFDKDGSYIYPETFSIEDVGGTAVITLHGLDIISILNLVVYMYDDKVIPAWNFTREAASMAFRYRQVRTELMKVSALLNMSPLVEAVRLQVNPKKTLGRDLDLAYQAEGFFDSGDVLLELDGAAVPAHSSLLCQRCPWFESLFHGRSGGMWLAGRREGQDDGDCIKIDLQHIDPNTFKHVLRHIYADTGEEMFDRVVCPSVDDFMDLVMDIMSVANELMLDRLSQLCQKVMGKFVNSRNIASLLNEISPCAVTEFKDAGLEYICLQMETMLENHLLDDLDEDLLSELDERVRDNQLAQEPFARSGRATLLLHEQNPELAGDIDEERQRRVKEMAFKITQKDEEKRLASSTRGRYGSLDESFTPPPDRSRKVSKTARNEPFSPDLRPKQSQNDLMFDMDDEDTTSVMDSPSVRQRKVDTRQASASLGLPASLGADLSASPQLPRSQRTVPLIGTPAEQSTPTKGGAPWKASPLPTAKLDLRDVFKPASPSTPSGISAGLAAQRIKDSSAAKPAQPKMSQKERKKQQQAQAAQAALMAASSQTPKPAWDKSGKDQQASPWKIASAKGKSPATTTPTGSIPQASAVPKPLVAAESSSQHVSRRTASPDTRFSGQSRTPSSTTLAATSRAPVRAPSKPLVPHSKSYITRPPKDEPLLGLSIADIMEHEQRERQVVREAVAPRSLQEIQQEQEFQQWWDAEMRRTQEEEARRLDTGRGKDDGAAKTGGRRGRGGKARGGGGNPGPASGSAPGAGTKSDGAGASRGKGRRGRGGAAAGAAAPPGGTVR